MGKHLLNLYKKNISMYDWTGARNQALRDMIEGLM